MSRIPVFVHPYVVKSSVAVRTRVALVSSARFDRRGDSYRRRADFGGVVEGEVEWAVLTGST
jgi:hypothetical protein